MSLPIFMKGGIAVTSSQIWHFVSTLHLMICQLVICSRCKLSSLRVQAYFRRHLRHESGTNISQENGHNFERIILFSMLIVTTFDDGMIETGMALLNFKYQSPTFLTNFSCSRLYDVIQTVDGNRFESVERRVDSGELYTLHCGSQSCILLTALHSAVGLVDHRGPVIFQSIWVIHPLYSDMSYQK